MINGFANHPLLLLLRKRGRVWALASEGVGLLSAAVWCPEAPFYTTAAPGLTHRTLRASTVCRGVGGLTPINPKRWTQINPAGRLCASDAAAACLFLHNLARTRLIRPFNSDLRVYNAIINRLLLWKIKFLILPPPLNCVFKTIFLPIIFEVADNKFN